MASFLPKPGAKPSTNSFAPPAPISSHHHGGGVTGLIEHLASDVKDATFGLPTGLLHLVEHPIASTEEMGKVTWETWSPLFHGKYGKFLHGVYSHPLAPLLDIATVFSLGAATAGRTALLAEGAAGAQAGSKIKGIASIAKHDRRALIRDTKENRPAQTFHFSNRAGRRVIQEVNWKAMNKLSDLEPHMPPMVKKVYQPVKAVYSPQARFNRLNHIDIAHRAAARNLWTHMALAAGSALVDPLTAGHALREITIHHYVNLVRHAKAVSPTDEILKLHKKTGEVVGFQNPHYGFVKDLRAERQRKVVAVDKVINGWGKQLMTSIKNGGHPSKMKADKAALAAKRRNLVKAYKSGADSATIDAYRKDIEKYRRASEQSVRANERYRLAAKQLKKYGKIRAKRVDEANIRTKDLFGAENFYTDANGVRRNGINPADFEDRARNLSKWAVTRNPNMAMRDSKGNYLTVPMHDAHNLGKEAGGSIDFLRHLIRNPINIWKRAQIGFTPRTVFQNAIGNYTIYALRQGDLPALVRSISYLKGNRAAVKAAAVGVGSDKTAWVYKHFGDELGNSLGHEIETGKLGKLERAKQGFYPAVHRYADEPVRLASILSYLRNDPAVKGLMKKGYNFDRAARVALKQDRTLRDRSAKYAQTIAGDYFTKSGAEKVVSDVVPFYLWDRHILKSTGNIVTETPGRAAILTQIGHNGSEETAKLLGNLPEFLTGAIPGGLLPGLGGKKHGRSGILMTNYLNPFATIGDLAGTAESVSTGGGVNPGEAIANQINPFATGAIQFMTGQNLLTGATMPRKIGLTHGLLGSIGSDIGQALPPTRLIKMFGNNGETTSPKTGKDLLFKKDHQSVISSLLGFPTRSMSLDRAQSLYTEEQNVLNKEHGIPTIHKKKGRFDAPPL